MKTKQLFVLLVALASLVVAVSVAQASSHGHKAKAAPPQDCVDTDSGTTTTRFHLDGNEAGQFRTRCTVSSDDEFEITVFVNNREIQPFDIDSDRVTAGQGHGVIYSTRVRGGTSRVQVTLGNYSDNDKRVKVIVSGSNDDNN